MPYKMPTALEYVRRIGQSIMDEKADTKNPKKFTIDLENRQFYEEMVRYFHGDELFNGDLNKGLAVLGTPGTGKTLAFKIFQKYLRIDDVIFNVGASKIKLEYRIVRTDQLVQDYETNGSAYLSQYKAAPCLCLDDVGEETIPGKYYGNELNVVQNVMEGRYSRHTITFFTSNYTEKEFKNFYDERLTSRMNEMFNILKLTGHDRRKN